MAIAPPSPLLVEAAVRAALAEDLGRAGDITSQATIPPGRMAQAVIAARKPGVIAGHPLARQAFALMDGAIAYTDLLPDGGRVEPGAIVARIEGPALPLLAGERVALNYLCLLSGVATLTAQFVARAEGTRARIVDTRKTIPGLRALQKWAVRCGGGMNHRFGLDDAILIKDNHIAVAGGVAQALAAARRAAGHMVKVEIEVDTLAQLDAVLACGGADVVLLDNMDPQTLAEAVRRVDGRVLTEASGGVSLDTVGAIARSGVDMISVGALTHSAPVLDLGLDIIIQG